MLFPINSLQKCKSLLTLKMVDFICLLLEFLELWLSLLLLRFRSIFESSTSFYVNLLMYIGLLYFVFFLSFVLFVVGARPLLVINKK